jgi:PKD repeat protein
MIKYLFTAALAILVFKSTNAQTISPCSTDEMNEKYILEHPEEAAAIEKAKQDLLSHAANFEQNGKDKAGTVYTIPIVFHVLHQDGAENISDEQIYDCVRGINEDFRKLNKDTSAIVQAFKGIAADMEIQVALPTLDPNGNCTNGVDRIFTNETNRGTNASKLNQWPRDKYLNIWVVRIISSGAAGYAYYPASTVGNPAIDGIVVLNNYVGSIGTSVPGRSRTLTHEIGHYLNLPHLWGSTNDPAVQSNCRSDDGIADTPNTIGWESCNLGGTSCGSLDNVQNYMEYSYCSRMFTAGQGTRMRATMTSSTAGRNNLWSASNLIATGIGLPEQLCAADFNVNLKLVCEGDTVIFSDRSYHTPSSWDWSFTGGLPATSMDKNPQVSYAQPGIYSATLISQKGTISKTVSKTDIVRVLSTIADTISESFTESFEDINFLNDKYIFNEGFSNGKFEVTNNSSVSGSSSIYFNNRSDNVPNQLVSFITPSFDLSVLSNPKMIFYYAYTTLDGSSNDEFTIYSSTDCGKIWTPRIGLVGNLMETAPATTGVYVPANASEWIKYSIPLPTINFSDNVRFKIEFKGSEGNNFYLDDFNITGTKVGLESNSVAAESISIFPNPASTSEVTISFIANQSIKEMALEVYSINGVKIADYSRSSISTGSFQTQISTEGLTSGMYLIRMNIDNKWVNRKLMIK